MSTERKQTAINVGLLVLRLGIGVMFLFHGWPKITGGPERWAQLGQSMGTFGITFAPTFWGFCAALAEFGGGIALILGLLTRLAAVGMACVMVTAAGMHLAQGDGLMGASHAIEDFFIFLFLIIVGAGACSLDHLICKAMSKEESPGSKTDE